MKSALFYSTFMFAYVHLSLFPTKHPFIFFCSQNALPTPIPHPSFLPPPILNIFVFQLNSYLWLSFLFSIADLVKLSHSFLQHLNTIKLSLLLHVQFYLRPIAPFG